jgi:hypothetical protein
VISKQAAETSRKTRCFEVLEIFAVQEQFELMG